MKPKLTRPQSPFIGMKKQGYQSRSGYKKPNLKANPGANLRVGKPEKPK